MNTDTGSAEGVSPAQADYEADQDPGATLRDIERLQNAGRRVAEALEKGADILVISKSSYLNEYNVGPGERLARTIFQV